MRIFKKFKKFKKLGKAGEQVAAKPEKREDVEGYFLAHENGKKGWLPKKTFESRFELVE